MNTRRIDAVTYGKTTNQASAIYGDVAVEIAKWALAAEKPVVIEILDFAKKKSQLETVDRKRSRMLSALGYAKAASMLRSACFRLGVQVIEVNPAYTSVIGAINFAQRLGISVHQGAAFAIARRGLSLTEKPVRRIGLVPTRSGVHVAFDLPVRNRSKHVWTFWSGTKRKLTTALAEHYRCAGKKPKPPSPLSSQVLSSNRFSRARFPSVSQQHRAADDLADVPF